MRLWNLIFRINKIKCMEDSCSVTLQTASCNVSSCKEEDFINYQTSLNTEAITINFFQLRRITEAH